MYPDQISHICTVVSFAVEDSEVGDVCGRLKALLQKAGSL